MDNKKTTTEEKQKAFEQLQEFRKNYSGRKDLDYEKELMEYLDERYLKEDTKVADEAYKEYVECGIQSRPI